MCESRTTDLPVKLYVGNFEQEDEEHYSCAASIPDSDRLLYSDSGIAFEYKTTPEKHDKLPKCHRICM